MLAYGVSGDLVDEYIRISESGFLEAMDMFYKVVVAVFAVVYLRQPTVLIVDTTELLSVNATRFYGMLESIDCMH